MNETYYGTRPDDRPDLLRRWMDAARENGGLLRQVFATPDFFSPGRDDRRRVSFRRCCEYPPVPYVADCYCVAVLECRIWQWVNGIAETPASGEAEEPRPALPQCI